MLKAMAGASNTSSMSQKEQSLLERKVHRLFTAICILFSAVFLVAVLTPSDSVLLKPKHISQMIDFTEGWVNVDTGRIVSSHMTLKPGETVTIEHQLPRVVGNDEGICFETNNLHVTVAVEGTTVFDKGADTAAAFGRESGNIWSVLDLDPYDSSRTVRFTFANDGITDAYASRILTGPESTMISYLLLSNFPNLLACAAAVLLGILLIFYYRLLKNRGVPTSYGQFLHLGLFILNAGVWCYSDSNLLQFFCSSGTVRYLLSYFSFMILPVSMCGFFMQLLQNHRRSYSRFLMVYLCLLAGILLLYSFNIVHISRTVIAVHICMVYILTYTFIVLLYEIFHHHQRQLLSSLLAFSVLAVACGIGLYEYYTRLSAANYDNTLTVRYGILCFAFVLLCTEVRRSLHDLSDIIFAQRYKTMAYRDESTGGNSIQYMRDVMNQKTYWRNSSFVLLYLNTVRFHTLSGLVDQEAARREMQGIYEDLAKLMQENEILCHAPSAFILLVQAPDDRILLYRFNQLQHVLDSSSAFDLSASAYRIHENDTDAEAVISQAQIAFGNSMAKHYQKENLWVYQEGCREELQKERQLALDAKKALSNHEFIVYLQPKIAPRTGMLAGAEALVRWQRPDGTILSPGSFIPLLEKNGFVSELDLYMFEQVCVLLRSYQDEGLQPPLISVNVSKTDLSVNGMFDRYVEVTQRIRPPLDCVELEFTESAAYNNSEHLQEIIDRIHSRGAKCSIDDFGSAYSNMNELARFNFDTVKLDQSFFKYGFPEDRKTYQMISGVVAMLKKLNMTIIAEGIETAEQAKAIAELDCDAIQGFYYSRPIPAEEFSAKYLHRDRMHA